MAVEKGEIFQERDVYVNYSFEEVMFRWDCRERKIYRRFYGKAEELLPVPFDNKLLNEALLSGEEISREEYIKGV